MATLPTSIQCQPTVPAYLLAPVAAPDRPVIYNRDLLSMLADYELLRRNYNSNLIALKKLVKVEREQ